MRGQTVEAGKSENEVVRSLLFAPATNQRYMRKLSESGSDAVVIDLEDAVAEDEKVAARDTVPASLASFTRGIRCVRVNGADTGLMFGDIEASICESLDALVVPKVTSAEVLHVVDALLSRREAEMRLPAGGIGIFPLLETAAGVQRAGEIAMHAPARVRQLVFGLGDFSADVGIEPGPDGLELLFARSVVVTASRAAGLPGPIDGPYLRLHDIPSLVADTERSRRLGFLGRVLIHPEQVLPTHRVFSELDEDHLRRARTIVNRFEEAEAAGLASIDVDGDFVDYPIYHQQRALLDRHSAAIGRDVV